MYFVTNDQCLIFLFLSVIRIFKISSKLSHTISDIPGMFRSNFKKSVANRELLLWLGIKKKFETRQATLPYGVVEIVHAEVSRNTENKKIQTELKQTKLSTLHVSLYQIWIYL